MNGVFIALQLNAHGMSRAISVLRNKEIGVSLSCGLGGLCEVAERVVTLFLSVPCVVVRREKGRTLPEYGPDDR